MDEKYNTHKRDENAYKQKFGSENFKFNIGIDHRMAVIRIRVKLWAGFVWSSDGLLWTSYELHSFVTVLFTFFCQFGP